MTMVNVFKRAPRTAVNFAIWGATFSILDCTFLAVRRKEDVWNPIMAGTVVGATLPMRRGKRAMVWGAVGGFVVLSMMEAVMVWLQNRQVPDQSKMMPPMMPPETEGGTHSYQ